MVDITHKSNTLREATAQAIVKVGDQKTIDLINAGQIFREIEKLTGSHAISDALGLLILTQIQDRKFTVLDLIGQCKAKEQDLGDRNAQQDK